ncbi:MAG: hypothetical protein K2X93_25295 [Candidatus Obscuribacterales bacterium]|nr:hypothetical protein [Candidatus Obscuribacterales bacterium]
MRKIGLSAALCTLIFAKQAVSAQNYSQQNPAPNSSSGNSTYFQPNPGFGPHYSGQPYGQTPQSSTNSSLGRLLNDVKGMVKDFVQVNVTPDGTQAVHVKAPFVDVGVNQGQGGVQVKAPFVNVNKPSNAPISVQAPLTNIQAPGINTPSVDVKAPFTNIHSGDVRVKAPFADMQTGSGSGVTHIHAPFADIQTGDAVQTQIQAPFTNVQTGMPIQGQTSP